MQAELAEEAHVVLEEHAQVADAVLEHGHTFHAQAEGEAAHIGGIAHGGEHGGVHHAAAQDLHPAGGLAHAAGFAVDMALAAAHATADVHFGGGFREGEEAGAEAHFGMAAEHGAHEGGEGAAQMGHADVLAHHQAFHLMEHGGVGQVGVAAVDLAGSHDGQGRLAAQHGTHLHGRGVQAFAIHLRQLSVTI